MNYYTIGELDIFGDDGSDVELMINCI